MKTRGLSLFRKYQITTLVIFFLLLGLILISLRVKNQGGVLLVDAFIMELASPLQKVSTAVIRGIQNFFNQYVFVANLHDENLVLRQKVSRLQAELEQLKEIALANERLRRLLQFREKISTPLIAAEVIGQDPSSWFRSITIDKGESDGIRKGMAVITPDGVVGQVLKTSPNYATVLLITDYNSCIDAIVRRTRAKTIVQGKDENRCRLKYLLRTEDVEVGDVVITSGHGGVFPKGLVIGEIRLIEKRAQGAFKYAELVPSVDLTRLEEVFVIARQPFIKLPESPVKKTTQIPKPTRKKR